MKAVLVIWEDAHAGAETWAFAESLDDAPYVVHSVGMLLEPRKGGKRGHITIVQSIGNGEALDSMLHVPKGMVKSVTVLGEVRFDSKQQRTSGSDGITNKGDSKGRTRKKTVNSNDVKT